MQKGLKVELPGESIKRTVLVLLKNCDRKAIITKFYDGLFHFYGSEDELPDYFPTLLRDGAVPQGVRIIKKTFEPKEVKSWSYPEYRLEYIRNEDKSGIKNDKTIQK